ncbi:MAG: TadE/TadG family type IV pilus assembly protein [Micropruina sp.]
MSERGTAESTQWALLFPALLMLTLGLIQTGIWLHGRSVVANAAATVAELAAEAGHDREGAIAAGERVARAGGASDITIRVVREADTVTVTAVAEIPVFFDVGQGRISERAIRPAERVSRP